MSTPVTIIAGYLGAGKTTLLEKILRDNRAVRYGVLVNDFAGINIDARLIDEVAPDRVALTNGCVCCTIRDDLLAAALSLVRTESRLEHLIVECSGVSDPLAIARALTGELAGEKFTVQTIVCLIDPINFPGLSFEETECAIGQAAGADLVLISKCDIVTEAEIDGIETELSAAQPSMRIARFSKLSDPRALIAELPADGVFGQGGDKARIGGTLNEHDHGQYFESRSWQSQGALSLDAFIAAVRTLPPSVFRAKGLLRFVERPNERATFQLVGKRSELEFVPAGTVDAGSMLVAIGRRDTFDARAFDDVFDHPDSRQSARAEAGCGHGSEEHSH